MDNGVAFKYTHFKYTTNDSTNNMAAIDIEVPCSHPSAICISRLTTPDRRAKTAAIRRQYKRSRQNSSEQKTNHSASLSASTYRLPELTDNNTTQLYGLLSPRVLPRSNTVGDLTQTTGKIEAKRKPQLEDFIKRAPSGMAIRPQMVFQCQLKPIEIPDKTTPPSYQRTFFHNNKKKPRFHFVHPDWFSERQMYHRLVEDGQKDRLQYGWI